jgi:hypothetical protein
VTAILVGASRGSDHQVDVVRELQTPNDIHAGDVRARKES